METRCGKCNKLFRVSDDKITGKGVKFACTRCGEYVRITKEEFERYNLSRTTVSALDMLEPKPKPGAAPLPPDASQAAPKTPAVKPSGFDLSAQTDQSTPQEEQPPIFVEPAPAEKPTPITEPKPQPKPQPMPFPKPATPKEGPKPERGTEPTAKAEPKPVERPEQRPAPVQPKTEVKARVELKPDVGINAQAASRPAPSVPPSAKREPSRPAPLPMRGVVKEPLAAAPSRTGKMFMVLIAAIIVIGLAGYGVLTYLQSASQKSREGAPEIFSTKGLLISKATGSWDSAGDLLISGVVENDLDKSRPAWYVVVDVYDAQGVSLGKIRLLNGKQLYTRRDYDVLAKRGVNIQELKTRYLQEQGIVIPPKGSATFELRYLQPPANLANFNATLQPFDPMQLFKEMAEDMK